MVIEIDKIAHELTIDIAHYLRRLGFPSDYEVPDHMQETIDMTISWYEEHGTPWLGIYEVDVDIKASEVRFNGKQVDSEKIYKRFDKHNVKKAVIVLATAGIESDERIKELWEEYPDQSFFLDAYAASVTESIVNFAVVYLKSWGDKKGLFTLSRYSPGYIGWDLTQQQVLMDVVMVNNVDLPVKLTESALLYPLKSQISVIGLHEDPDNNKTIEVACKTCSFQKCSCRENHLINK